MGGLALLTFMSIHLVQFRFGDTDQFGKYMVCPPPYLINFWTLVELQLNLFWVPGGCKDGVGAVGVRDIYALEFQLFQNKVWSLFYCLSVLIFVAHACMGWAKCVPVLGIPKKHIPRVNIMGSAGTRPRRLRNAFSLHMVFQIVFPPSHNGTYLSVSTFVDEVHVSF